MSPQPIRILALTFLVACVGEPVQNVAVAPAHFEITLSEGAVLRNRAYYADVTISPDGRYVVYVNSGESPVRLYLRDLRDGTTRPVAGVERGSIPFFSTDSRWIAFVAQAKLWKVEVEGGTPAELAPVENFFGGAWGPDGTIVYAPEPGGGLYKISANGGEPERLTEFGRFPSFLPDGNSVLFNSNKPGRDAIAIVDIQTGQEQSLPVTGRAPKYVRQGYLVFGRGNDLLATPFDPNTRAVGTDSRPVLQDVGNGVEPPIQFAVSDDGTLVYVTGGKALPREPVRVDLHGGVTPLGMPPQYYRLPRVSPDGTQLAYTIQQPGSSAIWVKAMADGTPRQLTSSGNDLLDWMTAGDALLVWKEPKPGTLEALPVVEGREPAVLFSAEASGLDWVYADGPTPDGSHLVGRVPSDGEGNGDIAMLAIDGSGDIERLEASTQPGVEHHTGTVSPDGRWLAFATDKSGSREVYVRPLGRSGAEHQVSGGGGGWAYYPHWSPDSRRLYFVQAGQMWRVDVGSDEQDPSATRRALFTLADGIVWGSGNYTISNFDLTPDGEAFVMLRTVGERQAPDHISVLTNLNVAIEEIFAADGEGRSR